MFIKNTSTIAELLLFIFFTIFFLGGCSPSDLSHKSEITLSEINVEIQMWEDYAHEPNSIHKVLVFLKDNKGDSIFSENISVKLNGISLEAREITELYYTKSYRYEANYTTEPIPLNDEYHFEIVLPNKKKHTISKLTMDKMHETYEVELLRKQQPTNTFNLKWKFMNGMEKLIIKNSPINGCGPPEFNDELNGSESTAQIVDIKAGYVSDINDYVFGPDTIDTRAGELNFTQRLNTQNSTLAQSQNVNVLFFGDALARIEKNNHFSSVEIISLRTYGKRYCYTK